MSGSDGSRDDGNGDGAVVASRAEQATSSASASKLDASATQEILQLLQNSPFDDVHSLIEASLNDSHEHKSVQRSLFLSHAPTFLSLADSLEGSIASLDSLSDFLSTFSTDLGSVSHQIATLKEKSKRIEEELSAKRQLEEPLDALLNGARSGGIVIDPDVVAKIFDSPVDPSWKDAIAHLEQRIEATRRPLDELAMQSQRRRRNRAESAAATPAAAGTNGSLEDESTYKALAEARQVAEACKIMAAGKIRPYLTAPFALLKKSVTTNLQIVQTSVLLPHHAPLYGFLARQMPRVAIDVQRAYVSAARLYFETGFRRFARSLNQISKRGFNAGVTSGAGGLFGKSTSDDAWVTDPDRLQYANFDGPGVTLAYQADDNKYQAPPEALYRSLTLVFFDNACSEYTFLVRYFEAGAGVRAGAEKTRRPPTGVMSPGSSVPATPYSELSESEAGAGARTTILQDDDLEPGPSDSASVAAKGDEGDEKGDLVQLSSGEKLALKGRGGPSELFKKIFEPVINTWLHFSRGLLQPSSYTSALPLMPLLSMIVLTDQLLSLAAIRGVEDVMTGPLLQFKMEAWPLFQSRFQEEIDAVQRIAGGSSDKAGGGTGGMADWMRGAISVVGSSSSSAASLSDDALTTLATRYAQLYSQIAHLMSVAGLSAADNETSQAATTPTSSSSSLMLFSSLLRLRNAIERVLEKAASARQPANGKMLRNTVARRVVLALDGGMASKTLSRVQTERSHWDELARR